MEDTVQNQKKKNPLIVPLTIIILFSVIAISVLGYLYIKERLAQGKNVFSIESVDPIIANKLTGSIVYSSEKQDAAEYFSPVMELTFKYNEKLFNVSEGINSVYISPTGLNVFTSAILKTTPTTDIKGLYLEQTFLTNLKVVEEGNKDDIKTILFSYDQSSFLDKDKVLTKYLSVIYKRISEDSTVYIEVKDYNLNDNDEITLELKNIINTISTDISGVSQEIEANIKSGILKIKFDRTKWSKAYQTDISLSLSGVGLNKATANFSVSDVYNKNTVDSVEALRKQLNNEIDAKRKYFDERGLKFEIVEPANTVKVAGIDFEKVTLNYNYGIEPDSIESLYIGFLNGQEKQVNFRTLYYSNQISDLENIETLLKGLTLDNKDIYSQLTKNVLGVSTVTINKATVLGQASTVKILSNECNKYMFSSQLTGLRLAGKSYTLCSAGTGSGFVIDDEGHIITNAHVADPNDLNMVIEGGSTDGVFERDLYTDIITVLSSSGISTFSPEIYRTQFLLELFNKGYITISSDKRELYIQGEGLVEFDPVSYRFINTQNHFAADLINSNKIPGAEIAKDPNLTITDVADLALIQLRDSNAYPSMPINSTSYFVGQDIYVIGYPGLVDKPEIFYRNSVLSSTVTKGTISSIKPSGNNTFDLIQIDASIESGNSGGPLIDLDGNIIGVATYSISSDSGNYNLAVAGKEVQNFVDSSGISAQKNSERQQLESALSDVSLSYYKRAKEKFQDLIDKQPNLALSLSPFVELCDSKIVAGESKNPTLNITSSLPMLIIFIILILLLVVAVAILVIQLKKGKTVSAVKIKTEPQIINT